jgi:hypothetical protein
MATPTIYRSDDTSAPTINGTSSALRVALNAILVDGYGSQAAAGWTKAYEDAGNHLVAYRQGSGQQRYLRLDDSATRVVTFRAYGSMTAISTGVDPFPRLNVVDASFRKSVTADSTARAWICLATDRTFYLIVFGNQTTLGNSDGGDSHFAFGELVDSPIPNHQFTTFIIGASETSTTSTTATVQRQGFNFTNTNNTTAPTSYLAGSYAQVPVPNFLMPCANVPWTEVLSGGSGFPTYPDPSTGKLLISRLLATHQHGAGSFLSSGYMPGLWCLCHAASSFTSLDTFSGSGTTAGRTFLIVKTGAGGVVFETGGNW